MSSSLSELESSLSLKKQKSSNQDFYTKSFFCNQLICQESADLWIYIGIKSLVEEIKSLSELLNLSSKQVFHTKSFYWVS